MVASGSAPPHVSSAFDVCRPQPGAPASAGGAAPESDLLPRNNDDLKGHNLSARGRLPAPPRRKLQLAVPCNLRQKHPPVIPSRPWPRGRRPAFVELRGQQIQAGARHVPPIPGRPRLGQHNCQPITYMRRNFLPSGPTVQLNHLCPSFTVRSLAQTHYNSGGRDHGNELHRILTLAASPL